ncbi:hypothetical protein V8E53_000891 [Lactarius tabidus]
MAPRMCRSQSKGTVVNTPSVENNSPIPFDSSTPVNINTSTRSRVPARRVLPGSQNHHQPAQILPPIQAHDSSPSSMQPNPAKKQRCIGPTQSRLMALVLPESVVETRMTSSNESEKVNHRSSSSSNAKGKGKRLERTSSFYPGRGDNCCELASLAHGSSGFHPPEVDDEGSETEEDPSDDKPPVEVAFKFLNKFSESLVVERPSWSSSGGNSASQSSSTSTNDTSLLSLPGGQAANSSLSIAQPGPVTAVIGTAQLSALTTGLSNEDAPAVARLAWPVHTELVLSSGSDRLKLTNQRPMVRSVLQKSIEHLRTSMLFTNAFPDVCMALGLIKDCLLTAANELQPGGADILERLTNDLDYLSKITPLPHARISLIRSEVKDACMIITAGAFLMFGSPLDIIDYIGKQLSHYTYTFPKAKLVPSNGLTVKYAQRVGDVIAAISKQSHHHCDPGALLCRRYQVICKAIPLSFPTYETHEGEVSEVPIHMVALVATALYATLCEWSTGEQQITEFSANAYLDVYNGHVNTLKHIRERHEGGFHLMMADIYAQANKSAIPESNVVVPIAELDLDGIDGYQRVPIYHSLLSVFYLIKYLWPVDGRGA